MTKSSSPSHRPEQEENNRPAPISDDALAGDVFEFSEDMAATGQRLAPLGESSNSQEEAAHTLQQNVATDIIIASTDSTINQREITVDPEPIDPEFFLSDDEMEEKGLNSPVEEDFFKKGEKEMENNNEEVEEKGPGFFASVTRREIFCMLGGLISGAALTAAGISGNPKPNVPAPQAKVVAATAVAREQVQEKQKIRLSAAYRKGFCQTLHKREKMAQDYLSDQLTEDKNDPAYKRLKEAAQREKAFKRRNNIKCQ